MMKRRTLLAVSFSCCATMAFSLENHIDKLQNSFGNPWYIGIAGGYGSTTWQGLVPAPEKQNAALSISTPTWVDEGGAMWGIFAGYEITPYFAIEANYAHYPNAVVFFDENSLFSFENEGQTSFKTHTQTFSLSGKVMLVIPSTAFRLYSSVGAAQVQREDEVSKNWLIAPTFSVGVNHNVTTNVMSELGVNFTAGYGESELNPAEDYIPFLFSVFLKLAYRF